MADFAKLNDVKYPKRSFSDQEDQSYGFVPAFKLQTGNTRGTQIVGYGGTKIDGANNRIVIKNQADGTSIGMGVIPGTTEFGFFSLDADGNLVMKIVGGTMYVYDLDNDVNVMQAGKLPDASYGWAVASEGENVEDGF